MVNITQLVDYGIQSDNSDLRIHVCVKIKSVYVFPTKSGQEAARSPRYRTAYAYTGKIKTGRGKLVPPDDIVGCVRVPIPYDIFNEAKFGNKWDHDTSTKGSKAQLVARKMIERNLIPGMFITAPMEDIEEQYSGTDVIVRLAEEQVKCDWDGGHREFGGTGYLFLQDGEINPFKKY